MHKNEEYKDLTICFREDDIFVGNYAPAFYNDLQQEFIYFDTEKDAKAAIDAFLAKVHDINVPRTEVINFSKEIKSNDLEKQMQLVQRITPDVSVQTIFMQALLIKENYWQGRLDMVNVFNHSGAYKEGAQRNLQHIRLAKKLMFM